MAPKPQLTAAAERQRRKRERRRKGEIVVPPLAVPFSWIEAMIDSGHLPAWDANDPKAVHAALERYMHDAQVVSLSHRDGFG